MPNNGNMVELSSVTTCGETLVFNMYFHSYEAAKACFLANGGDINDVRLEGDFGNVTMERVIE